MLASLLRGDEAILRQYRFDGIIQYVSLQR